VAQVSAITTQFLDWCCERLLKQGKTHWLLIWDHASWHKSQAVRTWIRQHNQQVKLTSKGVRLLPFLCLRKVPGSIRLNPNGCMPSATWLSTMDCLRRSRLLIETHLSLPKKVA
jgi:hypothetical protein